MGFAYWLRLLRTLRHLRPTQIGYRLLYHATRPWIRSRMLARTGASPIREWRVPWSAPLVGPRRSFGDGNFEFLNETGQIRNASDWNNAAKSKLWLYNLHYLDDLNAADSDARRAEQAALIERWIRDNPPPAGVGWEPYPLSLRLVNLIKWCSRHGEAPTAWLPSLARQARALSVQIEYHILGNHLLANGKALVFAGTYLGGAAGDRWLAEGLRILDREFAEQFLDDGAHFELSPMYHATLLWDVCDLVNLAGRSGLPELEARAGPWRQVIGGGLDWLEAMCHPDGEISFFNDAAFGIAPRLGEIAAYAAQVGCPLATSGMRAASPRHLAASGYVAVDVLRGGKLLLDVARVGPDYQPGHAHADTLSFELSLFGQRVLVNSGTSRYGEDAERQRQRSTAAHNTVTVDGEDSSEVWAGFRVARRGRPEGLSIEQDGGTVSVSCAHDGYRRLPGRVTHRRNWRLAGNALRVTDTIEGEFTEAVARFFLHPQVQVAPDGGLLLANGHSVRWLASGGTAQVLASTWHPKFGTAQPNYCIEIRFSGRELVTSFVWE
jgi:uncharacterized heparinase superfamily protein